MSRTTSAPSAAKPSAIRVAANAARRRSSGGSSEVDTTTTERARPSGPRSSSMNWRTSRPRSPTRAMTVTAASLLRVIIDSSDDLPTPEPAKTPMRWPRPTGVNASRTRTPSGSRVVMRPRASGDGASTSTSPHAVTGGAGRPSSGAPVGSTTRPSRARPSGTRARVPAARAVTPTASPAVPRSGVQLSRVPEAATTSASTAARAVAVAEQDGLPDRGADAVHLDARGRGRR